MKLSLKWFCKRTRVAIAVVTVLVFSQCSVKAGFKTLAPKDAKPIDGIGLVVEFEEAVTTPPDMVKAGSVRIKADPDGGLASNLNVPTDEVTVTSIEQPLTDADINKQGLITLISKAAIDGVIVFADKDGREYRIPTKEAIARTTTIHGLEFGNVDTDNDPDTVEQVNLAIVGSVALQTGLRPGDRATLFL